MATSSLRSTPRCPIAVSRVFRRERKWFRDCFVGTLIMAGLFTGKRTGRSASWEHVRIGSSDPVNAARFMTAASTLQRLARSAALNASYAAGPSRTGTPLGCLDIGSSPVQLRVRMTTTPNAPRDSKQLAKSIYCPARPRTADSPAAFLESWEGGWEDASHRLPASVR
jgi:hypothetical protein